MPTVEERDSRIQELEDAMKTLKFALDSAIQMLGIEALIPYSVYAEKVINNRLEEKKNGKAVSTTP